MKQSSRRDRAGGETGARMKSLITFINVWTLLKTMFLTNLEKV